MTVEIADFSIYPVNISVQSSDGLFLEPVWPEHFNASFHCNEYRDNFLLEAVQTAAAKLIELEEKAVQAASQSNKRLIKSKFSLGPVLMDKNSGTAGFVIGFDQSVRIDDTIFGVVFSFGEALYGFRSDGQQKIIGGRLIDHGSGNCGHFKFIFNNYKGSQEAREKVPDAYGIFNGSLVYGKITKCGGEVQNSPLRKGTYFIEKPYDLTAIQLPVASAGQNR
jgi:hypothetical protein